MNPYTIPPAARRPPSAVRRPPSADWLSSIGQVTLSLIFAGSALAAEGLRTPPDTARGLGFAGGRTALTDDASAARTNPAALADLTAPSTIFSANFWHGNAEFTPAGGGVTEGMTDPWKYAASIYTAMPLSDGVVAGLGITSPFGVSVTWPEQGVFRYVLPYETVVQTVSIAPAIGWKASPTLSLGAGVEALWSNLELHQAYPWQVAAGVPGLPDGTASFEADGWGFGAFASLAWQPTDRMRLTLTGRLPVDVDMGGDFSISNLPSPLAGMPRSGFSTDIEYPGSLGASLALKLTDRVTAGFDFEWIGNSSHDDVPLRIGVNQPLLPADRVLLDWEDSYNAGAGVEWRVSDHWKLRAGYLYSDNPAGNRTFTPAVPINDRHLLSIGAGWQSGDWSVQAAYAHAFIEDRRVTGNQQSAFDGLHTGAWELFSLTAQRAW